MVEFPLFVAVNVNREFVVFDLDKSVFATVCVVGGFVGLANNFLNSINCSS